MSVSKAKLSADKKKADTCVFCEAAKAKTGSKNLVLHKGKLAYVIMNRYPYTNGHLMVIPYRHLSDFTKLTKAEHAELSALLSRSVSVLNSVYAPQGYNIGMNVGEAAGAGIKDHLHYHIVPRWMADHNYMSVTSDTRIIMEDLKPAFRRLHKAFKKIK